MFEVKNQGIGDRVQGIGRKISYCKIKGKEIVKNFASLGIFLKG